MDILKYLDVLIGLAVVMVLLSPLVSAITQVILWVCKVRPVRLRLALATLIRELNGTNYDLFDTAVIRGLPPAAVRVVFQQPEHQAPIEVPVVNGIAMVDRNVPAMLRENQNGDLRPALQMVTAAGNAPWPQAATVTLQPRGTQDFTLVSAPANNGTAIATYSYAGPIQFASRRFTTLIDPPAGRVVASVVVDSGPFSGTALQRDANGAWVYPDSVRPMPARHDLKLTITGGQPGDVVTLRFQGDRSADRDGPVGAHLGLSEREAKTLAAGVLSHPMIGKPPTAFKLLRKFAVLQWGELVEREELIRILLGFASTDPRLRALLAQCGIQDPERAIEDIRTVSQRLEKEKPETAQHERVTQSILEAASSSFVGRINNWFDQTMDRTVAEYKFRAQFCTIVAALAVATVVQVDSIDLLRRLSTDDKLRNSLVEQAEKQQKRLDDQAAKGPTGEFERAKSKRDEIENNLATLRDPELGILPDHSLWQRLPQARLMFNPDWPAVHHKQLELVVGSSALLLEPQWRSDPIADIEDAIRNSDAPVSVARDKVTHYMVTPPPGPGYIDRLHVWIGTGADRVDGLGHHTWSAWFDGRLSAESCEVADAARRIEVRPCTASAVKAEIEKGPFLVTPGPVVDDLIVTSHRMGPLQLRFDSGNSDSNMFNRAAEWSPDWIDFDLLRRSWRGILLTWVLLSLGAPFWYDALKDLLKLRSSMAKKEEDARKDRQTNTPVPKPAGDARGA